MYFCALPVYSGPSTEFVSCTRGGDGQYELFVLRVLHIFHLIFNRTPCKTRTIFMGAKSPLYVFIFIKNEEQETSPIEIEFREYKCAYSAGDGKKIRETDTCWDERGGGVRLLSSAEDLYRDVAAVSRTKKKNQET